MTPSFITWVAPARKAALDGNGGVLDVLISRAGPVHVGELQRWLLEEMDIAWVGLQGAPAELVAEALPRGLCHELRCALVAMPSGETRMVMADPWDGASAGKIATSLGRMHQLAAATHEQLKQWLAQMPSPLPGSMDVSSSVLLPQRVSELAAQPDNSDSVISFVGEALSAALAAAASDIHFECDREGMVVKFRCDGVLRKHRRWDSPMRAPQVISRIKVLAQLDITETRVPQDGRLRFGPAGGEIDLRVSIMPSVHGEDAVLRVLDRANLRSSAASVSLDSLGFSPDQARALRDLSGMPHGMLLMTGPTGSGKTTTVYAALSEINNGDEKIITIEDPVEYELPGVLQIPVNERKGLTFARGLRSILRHDPDRILVGEIRDAETAEIAVQSALTGHLVFTTVHANSLFDVTGRFRHFGIDMFAFMSALNGVVVQRLLRDLCGQCRSWRSATPQEVGWFARQGLTEQKVAKLPRAMGCQACGGTGYRGRKVLAEVHVVHDEFRDLVVAQAPLAKLRSHVQQQGATSLMRHAAEMVAIGRTTTEEVRRVVGWI